MMKFGKKLDTEAVEAWKLHYIDYGYVDGLSANLSYFHCVQTTYCLCSLFSRSHFVAHAIRHQQHL